MAISVLSLHTKFGQMKLKIDEKGSERLRLTPVGAEWLLTTGHNVEKNDDDCHALPR